VISHLSNEQQHLIRVLWSLGGPSSNQEIYAEHRRQHPDDLRTDLEARIRTELQRYCETSSQFKNFGKRKSLKIFMSVSRAIWWLTPEYAPKTAIEQAWIVEPFGLPVAAAPADPRRGAIDD
jgi:hypothetical protein